MKLSDAKKVRPNKNYLVDKLTSCWLWQKSKTNKNPSRSYGVSFIRGQKILATHLSWIFAYGKIKKGYYICHKCDNPSCVNPEHLFLGTQSDNMQDCVRKNRVTRRGQSWKTHCKNGHPFNNKNTYFYPNGKWRKCKICQKKYKDSLKKKPKPY